MEPFGDLTESSREFIIALIEVLDQPEYRNNWRFRAIWQPPNERWAFTANGRQLELPVAVDTNTLDELKDFLYLRWTPHGLVREYVVLRKAHDQYRLWLKPAAIVDIFLNYREEDTLYHLGPLDYRLKVHFGPQRVFFARRRIDPGDDWRETIAEAIDLCRVMLVLIGPRWLTATDETGCRKLDKKQDIVRWEIETALENDKRVIPVLLEGVSVPREEDLPESLKVLPDLQAHRIKGYEWEADTTKLVHSLEDALSE